jgi:hypothetical protein
MKMTESADEILNDDYDSPWKEAVERYLPEFMAFYFPEESEKMRYVSSVEQIGIEKGIALEINQGITQGFTQGITQGRFEGEFKLLRKQLERRFGTLPVWAMARLNDASESDMESWAELVLTAPTLEAIFNNNAAH